MYVGCMTMHDFFFCFVSFLRMHLWMNQTLWTFWMKSASLNAWNLLECEFLIFFLFEECMCMHETLLECGFWKCMFECMKFEFLLFFWMIHLWMHKFLDWIWNLIWMKLHVWMHEILLNMNFTLNENTWNLIFFVPFWMMHAWNFVFDFLEW